ncbi:MAG: TauD/TfdA family dioxygenase, partial [Gammaproteobacteria bacterium]|nr:TauD/TfdA family dioxygenase [Gammaproteobacteria bacterium]
SFYALQTMQQFLIENDSAYRAWRTRKLQNYPDRIEQLIVDIQNPYQLTGEEKNSLVRLCAKTNLAIYRARQGQGVQNKKAVAAIAGQLSLVHMDANFCADHDSISSIQTIHEGVASAYIPYTNKPLNWHTDGYYNQSAQRIRSFLMHCIRPAQTGGENTYLDPEILYILLRDHDPGHIEALMDPEAMTIPPNPENRERPHSNTTGPVFMIDEPTQSLYMRYTARTRSIQWKDSPAHSRARRTLLEILNDTAYRFQYRLQGGEGVICNNVLHNRTMFTDNPQSGRLLYRARFYERVTRNPVNPAQPTDHVVAE